MSTLLSYFSKVKTPGQSSKTEAAGGCDDIVIPKGMVRATARYRLHTSQPYPSQMLVTDPMYVQCPCAYCVVMGKSRILRGVLLLYTQKILGWSAPPPPKGDPLFCGSSPIVATTVGLVPKCALGNTTIIKTVT